MHKFNIKFGESRLVFLNEGQRSHTLEEAENTDGNMKSEVDPMIFEIRLMDY